MSFKNLVLSVEELNVLSHINLWDMHMKHEHCALYRYKVTGKVEVCKQSEGQTYNNKHPDLSIKVIKNRTRYFTAE